MKFKRECEMKEEIEVKRMITRRTQLRKMLLFFVRNNRRKKKAVNNKHNQQNKQKSEHTQDTTHNIQQNLG
jgi:hypothetical protein